MLFDIEVKISLKSGMLNPEATTIIKVELFDGIKNRVEDEGTTYQGMSKGDYFMTMLEAFHQTINYYDKTHENQGGYFMRTPSDAPKNFVIQTTKFKLNSLITTTGINRNSDFYKAIKNIVYGELNDFIYAIQLLSEDGKIKTIDIEISVFFSWNIINL